MEAEVMESLKMQTLCWCKRRTDEYGSANYFVTCNSAWSRDLKFAHVRGYF